MPESATTLEDQLSFALFPAIARDFFEARERGELQPEPLEPRETKGPAVAHDLHLAPAEFNITVHGENYHVVVSGSGRTTDGRKPYSIRVNDRLQEVSLEPLQEVLASLEAEVLHATVRVQQHVGDLFERDGHVGDVSELDGDRVDALIQPKERLRGGQRDEDRLRLVIEPAAIEPEPVAGVSSEIDSNAASARGSSGASSNTR
jgi:pyruvate carboxylase subunit B